MNKKCLNSIIGKEHPCFIIAEVAQAHDGSLGMAHSFIDAVAECGVNAIKFQTHIAKSESTRHEKFRVPGFVQDKTRYDYWKRMEFTKEQWQGLYDHAKSVNLEFISTPFSPEAVNLLDEIGVNVWKVGSGDVQNSLLVNEMIKTKKPILFSTGMSTWNEIAAFENNLIKNEIEYGIFQCTSSYPCPPEELGINLITHFGERFNCPIGLSDHSGEIYPSLAAVTLGAKMIEVHVTMSKKAFGPDVSSSLTFKQMSNLCNGIRMIEKSLYSSFSKDEISNNRKKTKKLFSRSAFYNLNFKKGHIFSKNDFSMKKPGGGMGFEEVSKLVGKKLAKNVSIDDFVNQKDF